MLLSSLFLVLVRYCVAVDVRLSPFDWNIRTVETGPDYADNTKPQTYQNEFHNEEKIFHIPDKTNTANNLFDKSFYKKMDNKYQWEANDGNFKKIFHYNEKNPFSFSPKPFIINENSHEKFKTNSIFHNRDETNRRGNLFDKTFSRKTDQKWKEWKANDENFNGKYPFSLRQNAHNTNENSYEKFYTDNDRRYPNANNYGDHEDKNSNGFSFYAKYNYHKEPKINQDVNKNYSDKDDNDFKSLNVTENQNHFTKSDPHEENKSFFYVPFLSHVSNNFTSNIVCDKQDKKIKNKCTQKGEQTESPKDTQNVNEKNNEKSNEKSNEIENGKNIEKDYQNEETPPVNNCSGEYKDIRGFVGTNLIDNTVKKCFSMEEMSLLAARKDFEVSYLKKIDRS